MKLLARHGLAVSADVSNDGNAVLIVLGPFSLIASRAEAAYLAAQLTDVVEQLGGEMKHDHGGGGR